MSTTGDDYLHNLDAFFAMLEFLDKVYFVKHDILVNSLDESCRVGLLFQAKNKKRGMRPTVREGIDGIGSI